MFKQKKKLLLHENDVLRNIKKQKFGDWKQYCFKLEHYIKSRCFYFKKINIFITNYFKSTSLATNWNQLWIILNNNRTKPVSFLFHCWSSTHDVLFERRAFKKTKFKLIIFQFQWNLLWIVLFIVMFETNKFNILKVVDWLKFICKVFSYGGLPFKICFIFLKLLITV